MTLSIMENHDAIKTALKDYQNTTGEIPKVLDRYLEYVARTGKPLFSWDLISCLVMKKFENVFDDFVIDKPIQCVKNVNSDNVSAQSLKQECLQALNALTGVPFTIQRVCELLLNPKKNYTKLEKFLRGFLRVVKVVTTVDRIGQKITTESQLFANAMSPFEINESGDNWSGFSSQSDESLAHIQLHSPTDNNLISDSKQNIDYIEEKVSQPVTVCLPADSMDTYSTKMIDQEQQTSENIYTNDQYFIEQKTISMPPIGALFKPIDQLEAFVQNVSSQVESTTKVEESKKRSADESIDSLTEIRSSSENIDDEYMNMAKKRKVEIASQEAIISSSDVSSEDTPKKIEDDDEEVSIEIEAIPTMSSQATVCAEEPSSTNELKDDDQTEHTESVIMTTSTSSGGSCEEIYQTVDAGNSSDNQAVEADQSNCEDDDNIDQIPVGEEVDEETNKNESLSSSCEKESNSIDEETGEHV